MNVVIKQIDEIKPYDNNPRINENAIDKVAESIKTFGWQQPLVLDKNGVIIVGHTRYKAAIKLGIHEVPCVIADQLTEKQVRAYRIADNKTSDYSIWDNVKLLEELQDLDDVFTGFDMDDLGGAEILNERDNSLITDNDFGTMYEVVLRSESKSKIDRIKELWETLSDDEE